MLFLKMFPHIYLQVCCSQWSPMRGGERDIGRERVREREREREREGGKEG